MLVYRENLTHIPHLLLFITYEQRKRRHCYTRAKCRPIVNAQILFYAQIIKIGILYSARKSNCNNKTLLNLLLFYCSYFFNFNLPRPLATAVSRRELRTL